MSEQNDPVSEVLIDTVINKVDRLDQKSQDQGKRIAEVENRLGEATELASDLKEIKTEVRSISESGKQGQLAGVKLLELNKRLDKVLDILSKPSQSEVRHHHHFPAIVWAAAGLFLMLCLVSTGWYSGVRRAEQYRAGDFKYRYLKVFLDSSATGYLLAVDSIYAANPDSIQNVILTRERLKERRLELLDQINSVDSQFDKGSGKAGEKRNKQK